ncbi:MAG TPA: hypothetical protein VGG95_09815 [Edaphobacter sp.]
MSSSVSEPYSRFDTPQAQAWMPRLVRGCNPILSMGSALADASERSGQPGAMDDLDFFLARPQIRRKTPYIISVAQNEGQASSKPDSLEAAVLLYEHHAAGHGIRIFTTDDTTGRRTLISSSASRSQFALTACHTLLWQGAQMILISYRHEEEQVSEALGRFLKDKRCSCRWASREREVAGYLPMESTLEATMAKIGTRTRNHLRYYRRRVENQLGAEFVPEAKISREDFLALNRISAYPVADDVAGWRYDSLRIMKSPLLYGLRDRDGRWLGLIGGRHYDCNMEMQWQMNRADMTSQSLGTAMRGFLIEHEVKLGTRRMYIEGGTTHSMSHAFVPQKATDLIVMRQSAVSFVLPSLVKRFLPPENMLLNVLEDTKLTWHSVKRN